MAALTFVLARRGEVEEARTLGQDTATRGRRVYGPDHLATRLAAQIAGVGHSLSCTDDADSDRLKRPQ